MKNYFRWLENKGYRSSTIRRYQIAFNKFQDWFEVTFKQSFQPELITPSVVSNWFSYLKIYKKKDGRNYSPATINNYIVSMKRFLHFLEESECLPKGNYAKALDKAVLPNCTCPKWLNKKEKKIFLNYIQNRLKKVQVNWIYKRNVAICYLLLNGLRINEVINLDVTHVQNNLILVEEPEKTRLVPAGKELINSLKNWMVEREIQLNGEKEGALFTSRKGGRITVSTIRNLIDVIREGTKINDLTPQVLRHTYFFELALNGLSNEGIATLTGVNDLNTIRIYTKAAREFKLNQS